MERLSDEYLIRGIRQNDYKVLDKIYATYLPKIKTMVMRNNGTPDEGRDVFQEGLVVLFKKLSDPDFEFTSGFYSYFYGVCKFIWLRQLKKKHRTEVTLDDNEGLVEGATIENELVETERRQLYKQKFATLAEECQKVLQNFFDGKSLKEIAKIMGYSDDYVKRKKYKCKEKLVQLIKTDIHYKELI
jgi:RNA polymerase sigma factor (sigma-70 family)